MPSCRNASRWGVLIIIGFILTYALCYNIWSSFAFPFYLDYLHYTKDQVAFASKVFGIFMTMIGISLGGYLFGRIGRFPTVLIGAAVTPLGNLLYADLAEGGANIDRFTHTLRLNVLLGWFGADDRMVRLLTAICYENIATGVALTAFVAYLSGIISKKFTAVQYALLSSLTFLVGSLGRGFAGESFDKYGYPLVFRWTAAAGLIAVLFVLLEWWRVTAQERRGRVDADTAPKVETAGAPARVKLRRCAGEDFAGKVKRAGDQPRRGKTVQSFVQGQGGRARRSARQGMFGIVVRMVPDRNECDGRACGASGSTIAAHPCSRGSRGEMHRSMGGQRVGKSGRGLRVVRPVHPGRAPRRPGVRRNCWNLAGQTPPPRAGVEGGQGHFKRRLMAQHGQSQCAIRDLMRAFSAGRGSIKTPCPSRYCMRSWAMA